MTLWRWSRTAASNATADATINFQEGQAPSTLNDAGRGVMAGVAKYRDDVSGATVTGGTSSAYTLATYQQFDSFAHLNGNMVAFTPSLTNAAGVTLNVDGLGAKPLRSSPSSDLNAGVLVAGTPYMATYYSASNEFILMGLFNSPFYVPVSASLPYFGHTAPNSCFALPYGQAVSRLTYAALFNLIGTDHGAGDGSTTFNLPDIRGRLMAFWDSMGSPAGRLTFAGAGIDGTTIGATGGAQTRTLTSAELPSHAHSGSVGFTSTGSGSGTATGTATGSIAAATLTGSGSGTASISGNATGSGSLTATTTGVMARGTPSLALSGNAAGSGNLASNAATVGGMNSNTSHNHALGGSQSAFIISVNNGNLTNQGNLVATVGSVSAGLSTSSQNIDHTHNIPSLTVPYSLSFPLSGTASAAVALQVDAISVPYNLSLAYSASNTVNSSVSVDFPLTAISTDFSVPVSSSVSVSGSSSFTTNNTGSGGAFSTAQNTIVVNCILRII